MQQSYLYSNSYKIDVSALISEENQKIMFDVYGDNWKIILATKFQVIENQLHSNLSNNFGNISASSPKVQYAAGLADIIPFGHKQISKNDFKEIHKNVMEQYFAQQKDPKMLCSEFCANIIVANLVELNNQVKQDMKDKNIVTPEQDIIKIPFGKHENLRKMHPDRLLKVLEENNCVEKVSISSVNQFIIEERPKKSYRDEVKKERTNHGSIEVSI